MPTTGRPQIHDFHTMGDSSQNQHLPQISVVIPCYNRSTYLEEAVQSVLDQEGQFELREILVVDDHSDDPACLNTLSGLAEHDLVHVIRNAGRRGPSAARNVGIRAASGDWVAFLDSDDLWITGSLAARVEVIASHPECHWVGADYYEWQHDRPIDDTLPGCLQARTDSGEFLNRRAHNGVIRLERPVEGCIVANLTWTSTTMVQRDLLLSVGCYDEDLIKNEDGHLYARLALQTDLWFVPETLALYRQHEVSLTAASDPLDPWRIRACRAHLADRTFRPYRSVLRERIGRVYRRQGRHFRQERAFFAALGVYARSLAYAPCCSEGWRGMIASVLRKQ